MIKDLIGIVLGLLIGAACRWFDIPVPSPPKLIGALLVVAMTVGYLTTDRFMTVKLRAEGTPIEAHSPPAANTIAQNRP